MTFIRLLWYITMAVGVYCIYKSHLRHLNSDIVWNLKLLRAQIQEIYLGSFLVKTLWAEVVWFHGIRAVSKSNHCSITNRLLHLSVRSFFVFPASMEKKKKKRADPSGLWARWTSYIKPLFKIAVLASTLFQEESYPNKRLVSQKRSYSTLH